MATTKQPKLLTLDQIVAADDAKEETVPVPEWGGAVKVRAITKAQHRDARRAAMKKGEVDTDLFEDQLLVHGLVAPDVSENDVATLRAKNAGVVERIIGAILELSGLTPGAAEAAERQFRD